MNRGSRVGRLLASWRVLAVVAVVMTALVLLGVRALQQQITERAVDSAVLGARTIELLVVSRNLTLQDIWLSVDQRDEDAMDADLTLIRSGGTVRGLRVWALVDGHLVYGDIDHRDAAGTLPGTARDSGKAGRPYTADTVDSSTGSPLLAIYLPNDANGDGVYDAATEILVPRSRIDGTVTTGTHWLYGGAATGLVVLFALLFTIRRHQNSQEHTATHDQLTGLGNRVMLARKAHSALARAGKDAPVALLLIDLDGFKGVNDTLGHRAGDELLVVVSQRLSDICQDRATAIRVGGDEFAVLAHGLASAEDGLALAREIQAALREPIRVTGVSVEIDGSIGVAFAPLHATDLTSLMRCADLAMYDAKQRAAGIACFDAATQHEEEQQVTLVPELRRALTEGELGLVYQPMYANDGTLTAIEALLRWQHPSRGLLTAGDFVPQVARTSLIKELNGWVLRTAMSDGADWRAAGRLTPIAVNLPVRELLDRGFAERLTEICASTGFPPAGLRMQISEPELRDDILPAAIRAMGALRSLGVRLALDDVGASYLAMRVLADAPIDTVKMHPWLARDVATDQHAATQVQHMVALVHDRGATCMAKDVASASAWRSLTDLGCDGAQGDLATEPVTAAEMWTRVDAWDGRVVRGSEPVGR